MMTKQHREFHAPPLEPLNMTTIELITVGQLRDHRGMYLGDANALQLIREHAAFAVARFQFSTRLQDSLAGHQSQNAVKIGGGAPKQFSGPTKSEPAPNAGHSKPCGEVAGRN